jgi:hypothetical protein
MGTGITGVETLPKSKSVFAAIKGNLKIGGETEEARDARLSGRAKQADRLKQVGKSQQSTGSKSLKNLASKLSTPKPPKDAVIVEEGTSPTLKSSRSLKNLAKAVSTPKMAPSTPAPSPTSGTHNARLIIDLEKFFEGENSEECVDRVITSSEKGLSLAEAVVAEVYRDRPGFNAVFGNQIITAITGDKAPPISTWRGVIKKAENAIKEKCDGARVPFDPVIEKMAAKKISPEHAIIEWHYNMEITPQQMESPFLKNLLRLIIEPMMVHSTYTIFRSVEAPIENLCRGTHADALEVCQKHIAGMPLPQAVLESHYQITLSKNALKGPFARAVLDKMEAGEYLTAVIAPIEEPFKQLCIGSRVNYEGIVKNRLLGMAEEKAIVAAVYPQQTPWKMLFEDTLRSEFSKEPLFSKKQTLEQILVKTDFVKQQADALLEQMTTESLQSLEAGYGGGIAAIVRDNMAAHGKALKELYTTAGWDLSSASATFEALLLEKCFQKVWAEAVIPSVDEPEILHMLEKEIPLSLAAGLAPVLSKMKSDLAEQFEQGNVLGFNLEVDLVTAKYRSHIVKLVSDKETNRDHAETLIKTLEETAKVMLVQHGCQLIEDRASIAEFVDRDVVYKKLDERTPLSRAIREAREAWLAQEARPATETALPPIDETASTVSSRTSSFFSFSLSPKVSTKMAAFKTKTGAFIEKAKFKLSPSSVRSSVEVSTAA